MIFVHIFDIDEALIELNNLENFWKKMNLWDEYYFVISIKIEYFSTLFDVKSFKNEVVKLNNVNHFDSDLLLQTIPLGDNMSQDEFIKGRCKLLKLHYRNKKLVDKTMGVFVAFCLLNMNEPLEALTFIEELKHDNSDIHEDYYEVILQLKINSLIFLKKWDDIIPVLSTVKDSKLTGFLDSLGLRLSGINACSKDKRANEIYSRKFLVESKRATKRFYNEVICQNKLNKNDTFNVLYFKMIMLSAYIRYWSPKDVKFIQEFSLVLKKLAQQNYDQNVFQQKKCDYHFILYSYSIDTPKALSEANTTLNFDYQLKEKLDYIVHHSKTFSPKALNLSCNSEPFDDAVELAKSVTQLVPINQLSLLTEHIQENNSSLDANFLKKSFKDIKQFNETYFKTFSQFPCKKFDFEEVAQTGLDTIFLIVIQRLQSLFLNYNQQSFDNKHIITNINELEVFNETYYETFSNFKSKKISKMTFKENVQFKLEGILLKIIKPFTSLLPKLNQQNFDDRIVVKKFKELDKFNKTYFKTLAKFSHENFSFERIVNKTLNGMIISLLNQVSQDLLKIVRTKMSLLSKIFKEAITVTPIHNRDLEENVTFQNLIKDTKIANKVVEELEDEFNNIIGKLDVIKDLNKNRFQDVSKELVKLDELLKVNIDYMKKQITIVNNKFQGKLFF